METIVTPILAEMEGLAGSDLAADTTALVPADIQGVGVSRKPMMVVKDL